MLFVCVRVCVVCVCCVLVCLVSFCGLGVHVFDCVRFVCVVVRGGVRVVRVLVGCCVCLCVIVRFVCVFVCVCVCVRL